MDFYYFQKSSFSKFDAMQKKNLLHVRSSDSSKAQEKFSVSTKENNVIVIIIIKKIVCAGTSS